MVLTPVSRTVGPYAAVQAAVREHYYEPRRSSRLLGQELLVPPVVTLVAYTMIESAEGWHLPGDHHNPVVQITEGTVVGLFLVVIVVGCWTWIRHVWRPFETTA
jgi:hypothetical protein